MATKQPTKKAQTYYEAIGRRRSAVARVRLYFGKKTMKVNASAKKGDVFVNDMPAQEYFTSDVLQSRYAKPLALTDSAGRFIVSITVGGGGKVGQLAAATLGISRALELADAAHRKTLKPEGLLSRDSRARERRKPGTGGRARRQKQSPKR